LPRAQVVYAVVGGPYPEVPRAYPGLSSYMRGMGWIEDGPVREIYLVAPGEVKSFDELLCEVQIPVTTAP
jgi:effector-binding domain-containing protein